MSRWANSPTRAPSRPIGTASVRKTSPCWAVGPSPPTDIPLAIDMLDRARHRYPWDRIQTCFPFTEEGIMDAVESAMAMRSVKAAIVPDESIG